jgi:Transposase zinc-ribbon domain
MSVLTYVHQLFNVDQCQAYIHTLRWKDRPLQCPRCQSQDCTFRTLFPGSMRVFRGAPFKHAGTGHIKPLQRVSLDAFLISSRHHTNMVPGEAANG